MVVGASLTHLVFLWPGLAADLVVVYDLDDRDGAEAVLGAARVLRPVTGILVSRFRLANLYCIIVSPKP